MPVVSSSGFTGWHNEAKAEPPGVVTGRYGTIGEVFYVDQPYWPLNTALYVIDFKGNDPKFIAYFLREKLKNYQSDKAAVPGVDRKVLHRLPAQCPDTQTQQAIIRTLSAYDDLIDNNRRRIGMLEETARQLYKEWFVRFRFPGHEHVKIIRGVPEGWKVVSIQAVCRGYDDGDWLETKDQSGTDYRILQISNIGDNCFVETGNWRFISDETFRRLNCNEVLPGDILVSRMPRPIGRGWMVTKMPFRMVTAVDATIVRPDSEQVEPYFLLHHINSTQNIERCEANASGATRPRVAKRIMGDLPVNVPPKSLQRQFAEFAAQNNLLRENLAKQNDSLARSRDLLLPKLMSGAIVV